MARRAAAVFFLMVALETESLARSRDFSAPPEVHETPAPRGRGLYLSADIGFDGLIARWRERAFDHDASETDIGFVLGARVGAQVVPNMALFLDVRARAPLVVPVFGLYTAEAGIGGRALLGANFGWHLDLSLRHAWAQNATFCCRSQPDINSFNNVWISELGFGAVDRRGRVDRGWTFSLLGGVIRSTGASGWVVGLGIVHTWSRS